MIEQLKEASKLVVIPGLVLYFFGFITINAYLARFGIVSFDAINSRFVIAGIYPLLSLLIVIYLSWYLFKNIPFFKLFEHNSWASRFLTHVTFIASVFTASYVLSLLMKLGDYRAPISQDHLLFKPVIGAYDYIGEQIANLPIHLGVSLNYVIKSSLYIFSYALIPTLLIVAGIIVFRWLFEQTKFIKSPTLEPTATPVTSEHKKIMSLWIMSILLF